MSLHPAVNTNDHAKGNLEAALTIVEFGDYQCPYCGAAHPVVEEIMKTYGSQIKFVFRNFPLPEIHAHARQAAQAAEAAALQGKFWEMHNTIFENQHSLNSEDLLQYAKTLGLDTAQFEKDVASENIDGRIDGDFESGIRSGVNGTPSFFINGKKFDGGATDLLEVLKESVQ